MTRRPLTTSARGLALVAALAINLPLFAQQSPDPNQPQGAELAFPSDWKIRLDHPTAVMHIGDQASDDVFFVNMTPGWHLRSTPPVIAWHPGLLAGGTYRVTADIHLFDPDGSNRGFGILFGGQQLERPERAIFDVFLIRNTGEYRLEGHNSRLIETIADWSDAPSVRPFTDATDGSVLNAISMDVGPEIVRFEVNDELVAELPRNEVNTEGYVGLRVEGFLNLHISDLRIVPSSASP